MGGVFYLELYSSALLYSSAVLWLKNCFIIKKKSSEFLIKFMTLQ